MSNKSYSLTEILAVTGGVASCEKDVQVTGVQSLLEATETELSFLGNKKYSKQIPQSKAAVILVPEDFDTSELDQLFISCVDPSSAFSKVIDAFAPEAIQFPAGIHASAVVAESAQVSASAHIGANAVIEAEAVIGDNAVICPGTYVGHFAKVAENSLLHPNVTVRERCEIGADVIVHSGTTVGSDGFGFIPGAQGHSKIPQVGNVVLADKVEVGANCAIDRARFGTTYIGEGTKVDNLVQIAHNVKIGKHCFIVSQTGIAGSANVGNFVITAGQSGVGGHITVGDGATITGQSGLTVDVPAKAIMTGSPAVPQREYMRERLAIKKIGKLEKQIKEMQKILAELKGE